MADDLDVELWLDCLEDEVSSDNVMSFSFCLFRICLFERFREVSKHIFLGRSKRFLFCS